MSDEFRLLPEVNEKAKLAISMALTKKEPYCVLSMERKGKMVYSVHPYTGLAVDPKKVTLEFFAGSRVEPELLRRQGILW